jgi:hypothetical protein
MDMRILVAFEEGYRAYREVIAAGIRILRPHAEVETSSLEALPEHIEHFDPQLVICGGHVATHTHPGGRPAWVELSMDSTLTAKVSAGGRYSERTNPTLEVLLAILDEVEDLALTGGDLDGR